MPQTKVPCLPEQSPGAVLLSSLISLGLWIAAADSHGHHSFPVTFNTSQVTEVDGVVTELRWFDPHVVFSVEASDGGVWEVESNSIRGMLRYGISEQMLAVGTSITIAGFPARNGDTKMYSSNLLLSDGTEIVLRPGSEPRWTQGAQ
jgi:hypothetical protein